MRCPKCRQDQTRAVGPVYEPEEATTGRLVAMWIFSALGGVIGVILASIMIGAKHQDRSPRYIKSHRIQGIIALVLAVCSTIFFFALGTAGY